MKENPSIKNKRPVTIRFRLNRFLYKSYGAYFRFRQWRRKKLTPLGIFALFFMVASASFVNTFSNTVYQIFALLFPAFIVSFFFSLKKCRSFSVKRQLPEYATSQIPFTYGIDIENRKGADSKDYYLIEDLKDPRPTFKTFVTEPEPDEHKRVWLDRKTKIYRWFWHIEKNRNTDVKTYAIPPLLKNEKKSIEISMVPKRRGVIEFEGMTFLKPDPLGLFMSLYQNTSRDRLMVLPKRYQLPDISLPGRRRHHTGGIALSSSVGNSDEFVSLREYRVGDSLKMIHWKSFAKTGKLIIKENQDEHFSRHAVVLDTFLSLNHPDVFEEAVSVAASFVAKVKTGESILDFMFVGNRAHSISTGRGIGGKKKILEILVSVKPSPEKSFAMLKNLVLRYADLLSGCILILTRHDEERKSLIRALSVRKIPVKIFFVHSGGKTSWDAEKARIRKSMEAPIHFLRTGSVQEDLNRKTKGVW